MLLDYSFLASIISNCCFSYSILASNVSIFCYSNLASDVSTCFLSINFPSTVPWWCWRYFLFCLKFRRCARKKIRNYTLFAFSLIRDNNIHSSACGPFIVWCFWCSTAMSVFHSNENNSVNWSEWFTLQCSVNCLSYKTAKQTDYKTTTKQAETKLIYAHQ